jgi:2-keto-4-pentenoate hydratase/2-oxohepta-3-ene-1,7-dioic acid hydratase in catechol pathway
VKLSVKEAGRSPPPFPFIFFKPTTCIADHNSDVIIPKICQDDQADYEGELVTFKYSALAAPQFWLCIKCLIMGRDCKDVSEADAMSYVAAYTCGNDISSRKLQRDPAFAGRIPQWGFSKGFDTFAPLGPCLVNSELIEDPSKLDLKTTVDGQVRQEESVGDLLFGCAYLISYLSSGTTLQKGSVIMTGTPGGVGAGMDPPQYLIPGTVMEVHISGIGTLRNGVQFAWQSVIYPNIMLLILDL